MTTKPQVGGNIYNDELEKARQASETLRRALSQLVDEPGQNARLQLIAKAAVALNELQSTLMNLDRIGRDTKRS